MLRYKYRKIFMTIIISLLLTGCANQQSENVSVVKYEDKEYVELEYPQSIFYYDYNGNPHDNFEEVDGIYPIDSPKWEVIWNGGDLYCIKDRAEEAKEYYASDANYVWYLFIGDEDDEDFVAVDIELTESELEEVCKLEELERSASVFWEEFDDFGSIAKISKDSVVRGTLSIAKYDGNWYWKSEVIDESREKDGTWPDYVQPLPESLNEKIKAEEW